SAPKPTRGGKPKSQWKQVSLAYMSILLVMGPARVPADRRSAPGGRRGVLWRDGCATASAHDLLSQPPYRGSRRCHSVTSAGKPCGMAPRDHGPPFQAGRRQLSL